MRLRRLIILAAALVAGALLLLCFAPFLVAGGLRFWAQRTARREGLQLEIGNIEAPLLRRVVVRDLSFRIVGVAHFGIDCTSSRLEYPLKLSALFNRSRRPVRALH